MAKKKARSRTPVDDVSKVPRLRDEWAVIAGKPFCWRVDDIDWEGPFGWMHATCEQLLRYIVPRLHNLESMTWGQVEGATGSHFVELADIDGEAQRRLTAIGKDEQARLFSLRITGEMRLWGIQDVAILRVLWWDPKHAVCPAYKKHT